MAIQNNQPDANCAEISLFGPGIGECVVLHAGQGRWFVIDSCLCPTTKIPIALVYLESLGIDVATQVQGILITHWHRDHIEGAFDLLKSCSKAKIYVSGALFSREAAYLASLFRKDVFASTDKEIREFAEVVKYLYETKDRHRIDTVGAGHTFFDMKGHQATRLVALSPSSTAKLQAMANLLSQKPAAESRRVRNVVAQTPNLNAVALHFSFGDFSAVLGSDLEESGNSATGWSGILGSGQIDSLTLSKAALFKVPHHGSENGHHKNVWSDMLASQPISITTPYTNSDLPTESDIARIRELSDVFWVSRDPRARRVVKRNRMVEREMNAVIKERRTINDRIGHLQLRVSLNGDVSMATNGLPVAYRS